MTPIFPNMAAIEIDLALFDSKMYINHQEMHFGYKKKRRNGIKSLSYWLISRGEGEKKKRQIMYIHRLSYWLYR